MVVLLRFVIVSMGILAVIVNWLTNPLTLYLVRKENRRYNVNNI